MINVIIAVDSKYGIGLDNKLPWNIKDELKIFKDKTINSVLIVGRKTADSLPYLHDRTIICVTRKSPIKIARHENTGSKCGIENLQKKENIIYYTGSIEHALEKAKTEGKQIFVIGGSQIYDEFFKKYKRDITVHISFLKNSYTCDIFFNKNNLDNFYIKEKSSHELFEHYVMVYQKYGEYQYLNLLKDVLTNGEKRIGRNGEIISDFGKHLKFDLRDGFPLLTTKKMFLKGIIEELLFFIRGETDTKSLESQGIKIWKANTSREFLDSMGFVSRPEGIMGPMYGYIWRYFGAKYDEETGKPLEKGIDQLQNVIDLINKDPTSRRILLTDYNPSQANLGVLFCCHSIIIQLYVQGDFLDMFCYNRSNDLFLGNGFNIASSALFLMIISKITNKKARYLNLSIGDAHIYGSHIEQVKEQIARLPFILPKIILPEFRTLADVEKLTYTDFILIDYNCHSSIKAEMIA